MIQVLERGEHAIRAVVVGRHPCNLEEGITMISGKEGGTWEDILWEANTNWSQSSQYMG